MKNIIMPFVILAMIGGTGCYLASRLHKGLMCFFPRIKFCQVLVAICVLVLLIVLSFVRALTPLPTGIKNVLGIVGGYAMGVAMYLLLYTIVSDIVICIPRIAKISFVRYKYFDGIITIAVLGLTIVTCIFGFINARIVKHTSYEISLSNSQSISDLKIVMISDLHLGAIGSESKLEEIVNQINSQNPDLVCIAGDFFDTDFSAIQNPEKALDTLKKIKSSYGIYACSGNHDGGTTLGEMKDFLEKADITLLDDTYTIVDNRLVLVGRIDSGVIGGYGDEQRKPIDTFFTRDDFSMPVIVLDHNPKNISDYSNQADLILCGHTHKGQVFPANLVTNLIFDVDYGYYQKNSQSPQVIVSSGVGTWGMPMRVGSDCEIVTICFN